MTPFWFRTPGARMQLASKLTSYVFSPAAPLGAATTRAAPMAASVATAASQPMGLNRKRLSISLLRSGMSDERDQRRPAEGASLQISLLQRRRFCQNPSDVVKPAQSRKAAAGRPENAACSGRYLALARLQAGEHHGRAPGHFGAFERVVERARIEARSSAGSTSGSASMPIVIRPSWFGGQSL